jgi:TnpA family transposase
VWPNKGEDSNSLRRAAFFHRQGEIRDRTFENQSFRASGLNLITAATELRSNRQQIHRQAERRA